jgi:hypothetical protein
MKSLAIENVDITRKEANKKDTGGEGGQDE